MKDLSEVKTFIGWEITRDIWEKILKMDQKRYIRELLESESMSLCYPIALTMKTDLSLIFDKARNHLSIDIIAYQYLIRKLIYLACGRRPDITFVIGQLSHPNFDL